jgi:uncharacterized protein (DUF2267 family)
MGRTRSNERRRPGRLTRPLAVAGAVGAVAAGLGRWPRAQRAARVARRWVERRVRYLPGWLEGRLYRLRVGHPDPDVADDVLADRIRSALGPLEKRRDLPRVHVMVNGHVATLHGEVPTEEDADAVESFVAKVPGVKGVESYLHVGLIPGDTRPSEGRAAERSEAHRRLAESAARPAGVPAAEGARLARVVLGTFVSRIPEGERNHLLAHLPRDAQALAQPVRRRGVVDLRTEDQLVRSVAQAAGLAEDTARRVCESVLGALRELVPEEAADVAAVLPADLREMWNAAVPG